MKSIVSKFLPGIVVSLLTVVVGSVCLARAQSKAESPAAPIPQAVYAPVQPQPAPLTVCGSCGQYLEAARPVWVAQPTPGQYQAGPRDRRQAYQGGHDHGRDRAQACDYGPEPVVYYVGGMPPDRPAFPRTSYDLPRIQHGDGRYISPGYGRRDW